MSQTDRQTDNIDPQAKSTWWILTSFPQDQVDKLKDVSTYPEWLCKVYGGLEMCPDTGRTHFQGALQCRRQVRYSTIHQWLGHSWFRPAKAAEAARKYAMKSETAIEDKQVRENPTPYYTAQNIMELLGQTYRDNREEADQYVGEGMKPAMQYWFLVRCILEKDRSKVQIFMNPTIEKVWTNTAGVWKSAPLLLQAQTDSDSSEASA